MHATPRTSRLISFSVATLATVALLCGVAALRRPQLRPELRRHLGGLIFCDHVGHRIVFTYTAKAQVQVIAGNGLYDDIAPAAHNQVNVTPEWIEVISYVKPASGGSWTILNRSRVLLNTVNTVNVAVLGAPAAGAYWRAGFHVRVAYPGGAWSNWFWEAATPSMSYSGSVAAQYGYCLT